MKKQILLPHSIRKEMETTFKLGRNELQRALTYASKSNRAKMLRASALERGGLIYTGLYAPCKYLPNSRTTLCNIDGTIRQSFGEQVELVISRPTNSVSIIINGQHVGSFHNLTIADWGAVLYSLQRIYNLLNT